MNCQRCRREMPPEDSHVHAGAVLCDDCYMAALSPTRTCDPWAVYLGSRLNDQYLTPAQETILSLVNEKGKATAQELAAATGLDMPSLEKELATLRHMELLRGEPAPGGGKIFRRFADRA